MKTYQDLSDEQLIELHLLANLSAVFTPATYKVQRLGTLINVVQGEFPTSCATHFQNETGDFWLTGRSRPQRVWDITAKCKAWGVDYSPAQP